MMFLPSLYSEFLKLKRSPIVWALALVYSIAPWMIGLMMSLLLHPELGRQMGLMTAKAQMTIGSADWPTYLAISLFLMVGGMIVLSIAEAFVFGREYAEGTTKNMLTLPVGRATFVAAKLTASAVWFLCMAVLVYGQSIAVGFLIHLPGFNPVLFPPSARSAAKLVLEVLLLGSRPAWIAVASRGYLAPVGFSILLFLIGDLFAHTGWGSWVPWSIVLLSSGAGGPNTPLPGGASMVVLVLFFLCCSIGTYLTLDRSDNTQ